MQIATNSPKLVILEKKSMNYYIKWRIVFFVLSHVRGSIKIRMSQKVYYFLAPPSHAPRIEKLKMTPSHPANLNWETFEIQTHLNLALKSRPYFSYLNWGKPENPDPIYHFKIFYISNCGLFYSSPPGPLQLWGIFFMALNNILMKS